MPHATIVNATTDCTWVKSPPSSVTRTTGSTSVLDIRKMC